jgi:hypothetical protein
MACVFRKWQNMGKLMGKIVALLQNRIIMCPVGKMKGLQAFIANLKRLVSRQERLL